MRGHWITQGQKHSGRSSRIFVNSVFTSPTAVRLLMRYGDEPARKHDHSSLDAIFCAGEVLNAPAWEWLQAHVLDNKVPVIDHMWQTETGGPVFEPLWPGNAAH